MRGCGRARLPNGDFFIKIRAMNEMNEKYQKFLVTEFTVFDLETSGLNPVADEILEIAALRMTGKELGARFESLIRPTKSIPLEVEKIHGLNEIFLLANGRNIKEVMEEFVNFIGDSILVGHNIRGFDWLFVLSNLQKNSIVAPDNKIIDTLEISRKLLRLPRYNLAEVGRHFNLEHENAHRAMADVEFNAKVFVELMERLLNSETVVS